MRKGTVVGERFEIRATVGAGAMGVVYQAWDRIGEQTAALKVLQDDVRRFATEARALEEVSHEAIVRYLAHGTTPEGACWLAMEWLEGEDLITRLGRARLTLGETLAVGLRVARGLGVAHAKGIVHRDVKPANVFLPDRDPAAAKVLDFGIARYADVTRATRSGTIVGTVGYMSPEQIRAEGDLDPRSDVFSLGCVLYECLTGAVAFDGGTPLAVMAKVLIQPERRARAVVPSLPADVDDLVARMLSKDRAARPRDGNQVAERIAALSDRADAPATEVPAPERQTASFVGLVRAVPAAGAREIAALQASVDRVGGRLHVVPDGGLVVTIPGLGDAAEAGARAARCAIAVRATVVEPVALAMGSSLGDAIDRAATLLAMPTPPGAAIRVDDGTAALLAASFPVAHDATSSFVGADTQPDGGVGHAPTVEAPFDTMVGRTLAHYAIARRLGQGGMGVVYEAHDDKLHRDVALKVLPPERMRDEARRHRFVREARLLAAVTHPCIAAVYEIGEVEGVVYIAMERIDGKTIRELLAQGPLEPKEALRIGREIARGLAKAHEAGIVHRDLKPDNVMVTADGHVKVLDFGLSKALGGGDERPSWDGDGGAEAYGEVRTQAGERLGTPAYMSPEQAQGAGDDPRTDVFAFGATVYEMLIGRRAFEGRTAEEVLARVLLHNVPPASTQNPRVPRAIDPLLSRCLAKRAALRPANGAELLAAFDQVVPRPRPPSLFTEALVNMGLPVLGVLLALIVGVFGFAFLQSATRDPSARSPLARPDSVLACPVFDAAGVPEPSGWLGAAAAGLACERARVILGGRFERTRVPGELLGLPKQQTDRFVPDPYGAEGARARSLAAARASGAKAILHGKVVRDEAGFALWLSLRDANDVRLARGSGQARLLEDAVARALAPLVASGRLPRMGSLDPGGAPRPSSWERIVRSTSEPAPVGALEAWRPWAPSIEPSSSAADDLVRARRAVVLAPGDPSRARWLAELLLRHGRADEARDVALELAARGPTRAIGDVLLARADASEARFATALDRLLRAARPDAQDRADVRAMRVEAATRALALAEILGRSAEVAGELARRGVEPTTPVVSAGADAADEVDAREMASSAELHGATMAHVRAARREERRGDRARAVATARLVVAAWRDADVAVPAVVEMERLIGRLEPRIPESARTSRRGAARSVARD